MSAKTFFSNLLAVFLGLLITVLILATLEWGARQIDVTAEEDRRSFKTYHDKRKYRSLDEYGLYLTNPGDHYSYKQYRDNKEYLFEVTYSADEYGRRITPVDNREARDKYILFAGGSFTYGAGVEGNETLPYQVGAQTRSYMPYNYGFHGWGPYDVLTRLRHYNLREQIPEQDGMMFYVAIGGHINRVTGSMRTMKWKRKGPFYVQNRDGEFVRQGTFGTGRPIITPVYDWLRDSALLKMFNVDLPLLGDRHYELAAAAIAAIRDEYLAQFPQGKFYVVVLGDTVDARNIAEKTADLGIEVVRVPNVYGTKKGEAHRYYIAKEDRHPSPLAYKEMAAAIVGKMQLQ